MNFIISGKNIDVTPGLKSCIEQKLGKLERYFTPETEIIVTLSVEKERQKIEVTIPVKGHIIRSEQSSNDMYVSIDLYFTPETEIIVTLSVEKERQKIEVTIPVKGHIIRSEQSSNDMYVSIDLVEEVIERQLRKYKNKLVARNQEGSNFKQEFFESEDTSSEDDEIKIIRTKRFGIKPMFPEDACIQMDLLGHDFYVFFNAETEEVNVVYKRKNGTFGLIEPEFQ